MKRITSLISGLLLVLSTTAQITIFSTDLFDVGDSVNLAGVDSIPPGFGPGSAGPDQHWDFSNLLKDSTYTLTFIEPDSTPYAASFPNSNIAVEGLIEGFDVEGYAYATKNMTLFQIDGFGGSYDIFEDIVVPFEPPEVMFDFPVNYLDSSLQTSVLDITIESPEPAADSVRIKLTTTVDSKVDAWGELMTPVWTGQVLRIKDVRHTIDSAWVKILFFWVFLESNEQTAITYKYMASGAGYPVLQFNADTSGMEYTMINYHLDVSVGMEELLENKETEFDVYPNPAHGIVYCKMHNAEVEGELMIYDISGRLIVSQPVASSQKLYSFDLSKNPPGLYQVVLKTQESFSAKKLLVR